MELAPEQRRFLGSPCSRPRPRGAAAPPAPSPRPATAGRAGCGAAPARAPTSRRAGRSRSSAPGISKPGTSPTRSTSNSVRSSATSRQPLSSAGGASHRTRSGSRALLLRPQPARHRQHVEVRQLVPRRAQAMEGPARLHHRHVEGAAVVGDEDRRLGSGPGADGADQRALAGEAREHELADLEAAVLARQRAADQERHRAGAAAQAGGLEIEIEDARARRVGRRPDRGR